MDDLTIDELRRIQQTLRSRFHVSIRSNIVDIGFGTALRRGKLQPSRGLCITFLERDKKTPAKTRNPIPQKVNVRVKRGRGYSQLCFGTDVVQVGQIAATGSRLNFRRKSVTTGVLLAWKGSSGADLSWGLVTVGHVFPRLRSLSQRKRKVKIRSRQGDFSGTLIAKSDNDREIDAAIVAVERQELIATKLLAPSQSGRGIAPRTLAKLMSDQNRIGQTLRVSDPRPFEVHAYFPSLRVAGIGKIVHIISVLSVAAQTFQKGAPRQNLWVKKRWH